MTLIDKLRAADGPDHELFEQVIEVLFRDWTAHQKLIRRIYEMCDCGAWESAALALLAEKLPGWTRDVDATAPECGIDVRLHPPFASQGNFKGTHESEPIATILALFTALEGESA